MNVPCDYGFASERGEEKGLRCTKRGAHGLSPHLSTTKIHQKTLKTCVIFGIS